MIEVWTYYCLSTNKDDMAVYVAKAIIKLVQWQGKETFYEVGLLKSSHYIPFNNFMINNASYNT